MMGFVQVMDLRLQLADTVALVGARQFEAARRGGLRAINEKEIKDRVQKREDHDKDHPEPFLAPNRVNQHPQLKSQPEQQDRILQIEADIKWIKEAEHQARGDTQSL